MLTLDITWAYPDNGTGNNLAAESMFASQEGLAKLRAMAIAAAIRNGGTPTANVTLESVQRFLAVGERDRRFPENLSYDISADAVFIHLDPGSRYSLCYYKTYGFDPEQRFNEMGLKRICSALSLPSGLNEVVLKKQDRKDESTTHVERHIPRLITKPRISTPVIIISILAILTLGLYWMAPATAAPAAQHVITAGFIIWRQFGMKWAYENITGKVYFFENNPSNTLPDNTWYFAYNNAPNLHPLAHQAITEPILTQTASQVLTTANAVDIKATGVYDLVATALPDFTILYSAIVMAMAVVIGTAGIIRFIRSRQNAKAVSIEIKKHGPEQFSPFEKEEILVRVLVERWENDNQNQFLAPEKCSALLNSAKIIINMKKFSPKIVIPSKEDITYLSDICLRVNHCALTSAERLLSYYELNRTVMSEYDKVRVEFAIEEFKLIARYHLIYLRVLQRIANLRIMSSYFSSKDHILERTKVATLARIPFGLTFETVKSRRTMRAYVHELMALGNTIEPYMYKNDLIESTENQVQRLFYGQRRQLGIEGGWFSRRILVRLFTMASVVIAVNALMEVTDIGPISYSALIKTLLSCMGMLCSWYFLFRNTEYAYPREFDRIRNIENRIIRSFQKMTDVRKRRILAEHNNDMDILYRETDESRGPKCDIVIVMCGSESNRWKIEEEFKANRGRIFRDDVPFICLSDSGPGSGMAFLDALDYLKKNFDSLQERYGHLRGRSLDQVRTVIVLGGSEGAENDSMFAEPVIATFSAYPYKVVDRNTSLLDSAIINGYKACANLAGQGRGGITVVHGDGLSMGPIRRMGDITLAASWASYQDIKDQGLGLILSDVGISDTVTKLYDRYNETRIRQRLEQKTVAGLFDLDNMQKRQMQAYTGSMILSFDNPDKFRRVLGLLNKVGSYVREAAPAERIEITRDIIIPLVIRSQEEKTYSYLATRDVFKDPARRQLYLGIFDIYENTPESNHLDIRVCCPYHHESYYSHPRDPGRDLSEQLAPLSNPILKDLINRDYTVAEGRPEGRYNATLSCTMNGTREAEVTTKVGLAQPGRSTEDVCTAFSTMRKIACNVYSTGSKVLLSKNLFSIEDQTVLRCVLNKDQIELVDPDEMARRATNRNASPDKLACVMTRSDFLKNWNENHKINTKASILVLDDDLKGERYLYFEGIIGLARAIMNHDRDRIIALFKRFFTTDINDEDIALLSGDDAVGFAIRYALTFHPIEPIDMATFEQLRLEMESSLSAA